MQLGRSVRVVIIQCVSCGIVMRIFVGSGELVHARATFMQVRMEGRAHLIKHQ